MKDFDEFRAWIEFEKQYLKRCKKRLFFDDDYLWTKDQKLLSAALFFYYSYYHFGIEYLLGKAEKCNYYKSTKETIIHLIKLCQDIIHEMNIVRS